MEQIVNEEKLKRPNNYGMYLLAGSQIYRFLELLVSLNGQELVGDNISKIIGIDTKTVKKWLSALLAGGHCLFAGTL